jgi:hypothetical protein
MPGSHIPILHPSEMLNRSFDFMFILPWNIADEVIKQNDQFINLGKKFVIAIPLLKIL